MVDKLKMEDRKLDAELEEAHGNLDKMRTLLEKRIVFYNGFLKQNDLSDMDRLTLENKKEWTLSHLLIPMVKKELGERLGDLTQ